MSRARPGAAGGGSGGVAPAARELDALPAERVVDLLLAQEETVARAVRRRGAGIAQGATLIAAALLRGGRLLYAGTGTAGRLAALDAVECAAHFAIPPSRVVAVVGGGPRALLHAAVGDEDDGHDAESRLRGAALGPRDVLCVVAPRPTPFTAAALAYAQRRHSRTIVLAAGPFPRTAADVVVSVPAGPEAVAEAPWLKSATATKLMLAALSTATMVLVGKTYRGVALDVATHGPRGRERAVAIVREFTELDEKAAAALLDRAGGRPKLAIVMHHRRVTRARAESLVVEHAGQLRSILSSPRRP
jgi:N-acetylmuramic acid 6-phosphate etherase